MMKGSFFRRWISPRWNPLHEKKTEPRKFGEQGLASSRERCRTGFKNIWKNPRNIMADMLLSKTFLLLLLVLFWSLLLLSRWFTFWPSWSSAWPVLRYRIKMLLSCIISASFRSSWCRQMEVSKYPTIQTIFRIRSSKGNGPRLAVCM